MFWFLVSLILLLLWLDQRGRTKSAYERGREDMKRELESRVGIVEPIPKAEYTPNGVPLPPPGGGVVHAAPAVTDAYAPRVVSVVEVENPTADIDPQAQADAKERRTLQNLNTMLYVGSFLIVAAAALFVNLTMPAAVRLAAIILVSVLFYGAGILLHSRSERLRPAAVAFVGTGLAILPFAGFALYSIGGVSSEIAWLITSIAGILAYGVAAVRLQSQLVSYITMAFVLTFSLSTVSTLGLALVWYYISVIGVALICSCLHFLWPKLLPDVFVKPVEQTGQVMTPLVLVASVLTADTMDIFMYEVLFSVASLHYIVVWLITGKWAYEAATRVLVHITALLVAADMADQLNNDDVFAVAWLVLAVVQALYSLVSVRRASEQTKQYETVAVMAAIGLLVLNLGMWADSVHQSEGLAVTMTAIGLVAAAAAWQLRQAAWLYGSVVASVALPFIILRGIMEPPVGFHGIAVLFAIFSILAVFSVERLRVREVPLAGPMQVLTSASVMYVAFLVFCGLATGDAMHICWTMLVAAGTLMALSYLVIPSQVATEIIGAVLLVMSIIAGTVWLIDGENIWRSMIAVLLSTAATAGIALAHHVYKQDSRRDAISALAAILFAALVFTTRLDVLLLRTAVGLLLIGGIGMLLLRVSLLGRVDSLLSKTAFYGYIAYPILAMCVATQITGGGWLALAAGVLAAVLWASSYIEKQPIVLLFGHVALAISCHTVWTWLDFDPIWRPYGVAWIVTAAGYAWYWWATNRSDAERQQLSLVAVLAALTVPIAIGITHHETRQVAASAGSIIAAAAAVAVHGYLLKNRTCMEIALYIATVGLQRIFMLVVPEANLVVYGHWWALTVAAVAMWYGSADKSAMRFKIALGIITTSTGLFALDEGGMYSLIFLIEHLAVAVVAALLSKQWAMWWGIVAVVLAVLYFLRDYTALALMFLGFLIVLFVVWRLLKAGDHKKQM